MTEDKKSGTQFRFIIGIGLSLVALAVLIIFIDGNQVVAAFKQINILLVAPLMFLLVFALLCRAYAWRIILNEKVSLSQSFLIINAGYFVNTILPFRLGEVARVILLFPSGFNFWSAVPTILVERIFDLGFALSLFFIGLPFALGFSLDVFFLYLLAGFVVLASVILILLVKNKAKVYQWLENLTLPGERFKSRLIELVRSVISSLETLSDPLKFTRVLIGMALSWGISLVFQYLVLKAFIPDGNFIMAVFVIGAVAIGISIPSSPGNIGLYEASITLALVAFGIDRSVAFSYALTSHVLNLIVTTIFGSFGLVREGYSLRDIWQFSKQHREEGDS
jgi:glycosyltransferase 2 family protein